VVRLTGDPTACSSCTGSPATPSRCGPWPRRLAKAGFTVDLPLLPGHGTAVEDLIPTRWEDWSGAAEAAYQALAARCDKVMVAGLSVGGTLSCWLAEHHPDLPGIAVINPMIDPPPEELREHRGPCWPRGRGDRRRRLGHRQGWVVRRAAYPGTPLAPALSLFEGS
jgi:carboxylesterase